jgi:HSP20 family protein
MSMNDMIPWRRGSRTLARREEDHPFLSLRREMDSLFDEFFKGFEMEPWGRLSGEGNGMNFSPRVNVSENEQVIQVTAELPGIDPQDVDVSLARDVLTIRGEKKEETKDEKDNYYRFERSYGSFSRTIPLPAGLVNADKIDANFKNGVLTVTLPKREEAQTSSKRITVKAE